MCDIYRLQYYRNCCFNDVQFGIISILQKNKQNTSTVCRVLECVISLWDSVC